MSDDLLDELLALAHAPPDRFQVLGLLGRGGMGEVERVHDHRLDRVLARKVLRADRAHPDLVRRFLREARVTARLQHPGVVPVHDLGEAPDGRPCFTMQEVGGRPLDVLLRSPERPGPAALVDIVLRVAEAAAYAHSRGVVHRDIKPANVAVGAFGEVLLLDWGVARAEGLEDPGGEAMDDGHTRVGEVIGTPAWMAPEQARGEPVGPAADVYALGMLLGEALGGGPLRGGSLEEARRGHVAMPVGLPEELLAIVRRATALDPAARPDAGGFAAELRAWRDGDLRRARAQALVQEGEARLPEVAALRAEAAALRERADAALAGLQPWDPAEAKAVGWALQDEAEAAAVAADVAEADVVRALDAAVQAAPELDAAHALLADLYRAGADEAQARGDRREALRCGALVRAHDRGAHAGWLRGLGSISLVTDPPAHVTLWRLEGARRRTPVPAGEAQCPLQALAVPPGSYALELWAPGRPVVTLHAAVGRGEAWSVAPPPGREAALRLPRAVGPDEVWVPPGWFIAGGDPEASDSLPRRRVWVDGFFVARDPVTNAGWLTFLDALAAAGRLEEALRHAPHDAGQPCHVWDGARFCLGGDRSGAAWLPEAPVVLVDWYGATAYAAWRAAQTGQPWRLLHNLEREKAARGVDGRRFPWGDAPEPTWAAMADSEAGPPRLRPVGDPPTDLSPYGARGMAGNVRDWCCDAYERAPRSDVVEVAEATGDVWRMVRGGAWAAAASVSRAAGRYASRPDRRAVTLGVRLGRGDPPL